jgi:chromosome segregation ATPase
MSAKLDGAMGEMSRKLGGEIEGMRVLLCDAEAKALEMESKASAADARAADAEASAERERARADAAVEEAVVEARRGSEARRRSVELEDRAVMLLEREESLRVAVLEAEDELRAAMEREREADEMNKKLSASVIELDEAVQRAKGAERDAEKARGEREGLRAELYAVSGALDEMAAEVRGAVGDAECIREGMEREVGKAVSDAGQEVGRLRSELQRALGERDAAYREVSCVRGERDAAAASIVRERGEWEALVRVSKDESESVWKEVEAAMREREGVRAELGAARRERDQAREDAVSLKEQLGAAVTELEQVREEVSSLRKESELEAALGEEVMRLTVDLEALRGERGRGRAAEGELAKAVAELKDVKARVVEALERAETADKGRKEALAELDQARKEVLSLLNERDALSCERDAGMEVVLRLEGEIEAVKREAEKVEGGLEREVECLRCEVAALKREAAEVQEEEGEWERAVEKAREEREWALGELGDALERCERMEEENRVLRERVIEHEAWLCVLEECAGEDVGEGFTSISSLVAKIKDLEGKAGEVDWLRSRFATLERERNELEGAVEEHDAWLSLLEECGAEGSTQGFSSISSLVGRLKELEAETGSLREKLEAADGRADAAQNQAVVALQRKLEMKDSELLDCKQELNCKEREANDAKARFAELDQVRVGPFAVQIHGAASDVA